MELSPKQKKLLIWIGYPLLALFTFVIAIHVTFPYGRVKGKVIEALNDKYDVTIGSVEPTFLPGGLIFKKIVLQTRPDDPKEKPTTIVIDKLRVDAGLIAMLRGRADLDILAEIGAGTIRGNILVTGSSTKTNLSTKQLPLETVPGLASAIGLPMTGALDADIEFNLPNNKFKKANGRIELACIGCTIGDGKTKIKPRKRKRRQRFRRRRRSFMDPTKGLTVPKLSLGDTSAVIEIEKGVGKIKKFAGKSRDGEMKIEGDIRFTDPFKKSRLPGCFHFKLSKALKKREPNFGQIMDFLDVSTDKDGWGHMKLVGNLPDLSFRPVKKCTPGVRDRRRGRRPRVTSRPTRRRPSTATLRNRMRNLKNRTKDKKPPGIRTTPDGRKSLNDSLKTRTKIRGRSGPALRKNLRKLGRGKKRGDDVKRKVTVDDKGRPSDSVQPRGDDDDDDDNDKGKDKDKDDKKDDDQVD